MPELFEFWRKVYHDRPGETWNWTNIYLDYPITTALIMFNIDSIISIVFLSLTADVLPGEMSLLVRSKERWLFSQARTYSSKNWMRYKIHEACYIFLFPSWYALLMEQFQNIVTKCWTNLWFHYKVGNILSALDFQESYSNMSFKPHLHALKKLARHAKFSTPYWWF